MTNQRGYFGIGVEGISKPANVGNLVRSAHAFGASFFFTVAPNVDMHKIRAADTSKAWEQIPFYDFENVESMRLPKKCALIAVEFIAESIELPSFRHPVSAAYVLGPEMGNVSPDMMARCDHVIRIPMKFCINVGVAGAIVMYDRLISTGRFAARPVKAGGPGLSEIPPEHSSSWRRIERKKAATGQ